MMKRVHFLINQSRIIDYLTVPLRVNRRRLLGRGYDVRFVHDIEPESLSCDILSLVSKPVLELVQGPHPVIKEGSPTLDLLEKAHRYADKVIWFDSSDSTGVTHFELLPHVDLYLKKHLLRDKSLYRRPMYGGRVFSDFYHRTLGIEDNESFRQYFPLLAEHEHKVDLSWNMGLGELYHSFSWWGRARRLMPELLRPRLNADFHPAAAERPLDVFVRASTNWSQRSVAYHRKELIRRVQDLVDRAGLTGSATRRTGEKRLSLRAYRNKIKTAKMGFGPFGWGELNLREYETLIFGGLLIRPDISHMETWPDIFKDGETCVFYKWDFSDLEEKILRYKDDDINRTQIASNGQEAYRHIISKNGMNKFVDWFVRQIEL